MNILHAIPYLGKAQGGPVESLRLLASAQAEMGNRVRVVYTGIPADGELAAFPGNVEVIRIDSRGPSRWSPKLIDAACSNDFTPDVIHSHALWLDVGRQAARLSRKLDVPHIVSPCGMLQQDALLRSRWKKRIAWPVFQKQVLLTAEIIHAKSDVEAAGIRTLLPKAKIRVIPNPVEPPPKDSTIKKTTTAGKKTNNSPFRRFGIVNHHKVLLFLGRIHPVKGLDRLLRTWFNIHSRFSDWRLVIIGPDEDGYRSTLESTVNKIRASKTKDNDIRSTFVFIDSIYGEERWGAYRDADLFIAPSDFENFGQSIAEALCAGVPVITTTGTPWKELKEKGCGWWVEPSTGGIASALQEAMGLTDAERMAKGEIGKNVVRRFLPDIIAEQMCELYASVFKVSR